MKSMWTKRKLGVLFLTVILIFNLLPTVASATVYQKILFLR